MFSPIQEFVHFQALPVHHVMAKYLLELCLLDYDMCHYSPSLISAAAIYLALWYVYCEISLFQVRVQYRRYCLRGSTLICYFAIPVWNMK